MSLIGLIKKLIKDQGKKGLSDTKGSTWYEFKNRQRGLDISFHSRPNRDYFCIIYYKQATVYQARKRGRTFIREKYEPGEWEKIIEGLSKQEVFPFAQNELRRK